MKPKRILIVIIALAFVALVIWFVWAIIVGPASFNYWFDYRYRYRECEPGKLLSDLKQTFDINLPARITNVQAARTPGRWDSTKSLYIVKFTAEPNLVDLFIESFPTKITLKTYNPEDDNRSRGASRWRPPNWFTQTIKKGKEALFRPDVKIYIDTTNKRNFVVYLHGYYYRDPNQIREELEKD